jgi:flagellar motor switch protein FliM
MSNTPANSLSKEKIQRLLAAIGSRPAEDTAKIEAADYDWHQPRRFNREQLTRLDDFAKKMSKVIVQKFSTLCREDFNVKVDSVTQHFADKLLDQALNGEQNDYYLAFGTSPDQPCGVIGISPQAAFVLVTQLLGDTDSEKDSKTDLSQLEESLLFDIACVIVEALSDAHAGWAFQPAKNIVRGLLSLDLQGTEEFCRIALNIRKADSDGAEAYVLILSSSLEGVVGKAGQQAGQFPAEKISKAIFCHLQKMSVSVTARLSSTVLNFEELMNLRTGDILLLNKRVDEPVELLINDKTFFLGRPAKSAGNYAVLVTETVSQ